jgi:hypothetical protein
VCSVAVALPFGRSFSGQFYFTFHDLDFLSLWTRVSRPITSCRFHARLFCHGPTLWSSRPYLVHIPISTSCYALGLYNRITSSARQLQSCLCGYPNFALHPLSCGSTNFRRNELFDAMNFSTQFRRTPCDLTLRLGLFAVRTPRAFLAILHTDHAYQLSCYLVLCIKFAPAMFA